MNRLARYRAQGGQRFVVIPRPHSPHDILESLPYWRAKFIKQRRAGHELRLTEYGWLLQLAMRPTLHYIAQRESDLKVVASYREMLRRAA